MPRWKTFSIHMLTETNFILLASETEGREDDIDDWKEVHRVGKWSTAITTYRKMVDGNWDWRR